MDVKAITRNVLSDYDDYTRKLLEILRSTNAHLICKHGLEECLLHRKCYSCSASFARQRKSRCLDNVWPIMIGSELDLAFRKSHATRVDAFDGPRRNLLDEPEIGGPADIALTCFVINGAAKQLPFFITNDATNVHVVRNSLVRLYRYDRDQRGAELDLYLDDDGENHRRGRLNLRLHNGEEKEPTDEELGTFFDCPYPTRTKVLFQHVYKSRFDIDHLGNKAVFTPGHLFYRLFCKTLLVALRTETVWKNVQAKHRVVVRSIENGDLLHVLSKKTVFYRENQAAHKTVTTVVDAEQRREIGCNDQVFVEKRTTCYRDVNFQNYQLIPYLSQTAFFQISSKVKSNSVLRFDDSYLGFLCLFGTSETRNVGRQMMLARDVEVSGQVRTGPLFEALALEWDGTGTHFVVVNCACVPVTARCFRSLDLAGLKRTFRLIECHVRDDAFAFVNYKPGLPFRHLRDGVWVTPNDLPYWSRILGEWEGFEFVTSRYVDLIPHFRHNAFPKNVLALNALKNAVLATTPEYALFFRETASAYAPPTAYHRAVLEAADRFSEPWVIRMPKPLVMFTSFRGLTQEDCIVLREGVDAFDCHKLYTLKLRFRNAGDKHFHPARGEGVDSAKSFLGTVACARSPLEIAPQNVHLIVERIGENAANLYFAKPYFRVERHEIAETFLFVTAINDHPCGNADKLCSLAGQKGVVFRQREVPYADVVPDLLLNPNSIVGRQTVGQILEMRDSGRDHDAIYNPAGRRLPGKALIGSAFYFLVNYLASEHVYVALNCVRDKITGQPVRGRSRMGGMRAGSMEIFNGFRGNGLSACYEEKLLENSDLLVTEDDAAVPKSVVLCEEDSRFFKCTTDLSFDPLIRPASRDE